MLTVAIPKRNKLQNIIVLTPKDGNLIQRHDIRKAWKFVKYYRKISHSVLLFPFIRQNIPFYFLAFILEQVFLGYHLEYFRSLV